MRRPFNVVHCGGPGGCVRGFVHGKAVGAGLVA
jgi:hypothetical protein